jgi:2Fe-2S ferredoxin
MGIYEGREYKLKSYSNEYRNLMVLLKDQVCPDDFGQCGGMGRCGTCAVKISAGISNSDDLYKNEKNTLSKMGAMGLAMRLSCQIQIDETLKNVTVQLFDNI